MKGDQELVLVHPSLSGVDMEFKPNKEGSLIRLYLSTWVGSES